MPLKESWEIFEPPTIVRDGNIHGVELSYHTYPHKKKAVNRFKEDLRSELTDLFRRTDFLNDAIVAGRSVWLKDSKPFEFRNFFKRGLETGNFGESLTYLDKSIDPNGIIAYSDITVDLAYPHVVVHEIGHVIETVGHFAESEEFATIAKMWADKIPHHDGYEETPEEAFANTFHWWYNDLFPGKLDGSFVLERFDQSLVDHINAYFDHLLPDLVLEANVKHRNTFTQIGQVPKPMNETVASVNKLVETIRKEHCILGPRGKVKSVFEDTKRTKQKVTPNHQTGKPKVVPNKDVVSVPETVSTTIQPKDENSSLKNTKPKVVSDDQQELSSADTAPTNPFMDAVMQARASDSNTAPTNPFMDLARQNPSQDMNLSPEDFIGIKPTPDQLNPSLNSFLTQEEKKESIVKEVPQPQPIIQDNYYEIAEDYGYEM